MNLMDQLGPLAVGSRLKRLSDTFMRQASAVYRAFDLDFEPKWFTVFYPLAERSPLSITEIAEQLGFSHPAIIQLANELEQKGLVRSEKSGGDSRKRMLVLTDQGKAMLPDLQRLWQTIREVNTQLIQSQRHNLIFAVEEMEAVLTQKDYLTRFTEYHEARQAEEVEILEYDPRYRDDFKRLNLEWIGQYFNVDPPDRALLENPEGYVLEGGGYVFFARYGGEIVGTCALLKQSSVVYELTKMAVTPKVQGRQIGKKLCTHTLEKARQVGAKRVCLQANTRLTAAIELYRKVGFYKVEMAGSPYQQADVRMQIDL
ncbi:MAG: bifunctional helix-turn-helix transcriptional regulator/GNAT family N-acetyltransferase [Ferruginibacter sp.]|nr:bifunctional helix-turn-helix transcriptional regulator/GNAT family N-acetyltransferase [Cytophagales bacterium]